MIKSEQEDAEPGEWLVSFKRNDGCTMLQSVSATCETSAVLKAQHVFADSADWKLINAVRVTDQDRQEMAEMDELDERTAAEIEQDEHDRQKAMFNAE